MRVSGFRVAFIGIVAFLFVPSAALAAQAKRAYQYRIKIESQGKFTADYGEERKEPGAPNGRFGVDGEEVADWGWRLRAVGYSAGGGPLESRAANFKGWGGHFADMISWNVADGNVHESRLCDRAYTFTSTGPPGGTAGDSTWLPAEDDSFFMNPRGFTVAYPSEYELVDTCYHSIPSGFPGVRFYGPIGKGDAPLPPGSFDPRKGKPFKLQLIDDVAYGPEHATGDPVQLHTEVWTSTLDIALEPVAADAYDGFVKKYREVEKGGINGETYPLRH
jgi:hypothetical protein